MEKEKIFDIIDEYMDLGNETYTLKITSEKSKAFEIMMKSGRISSWKKDEYSINGLTKRRLDKNKIKYKIIRGIKNE